MRESVKLAAEDSRLYTALRARDAIRFLWVKASAAQASAPATHVLGSGTTFNSIQPTYARRGLSPNQSVSPNVVEDSLAVL
jgi:hypothetical protein